MEIRVLGPVEVEAGGRLLDLGAPRQRALLALLALNANSTVSVDRLIEGLWAGERSPPTAGKMIQTHVSHLRRLLAEGDGAEIVTRGRGYELRVEPGAVDAARFERLVAQASSGAENGDTGHLARTALGLWRGPPLADLHDEPFVFAEARRLDELRLAATELAIEGELRQGRHLQAVAQLESLVAEHPLRERLHGLLMLALYRGGRQAEALEAYRTARSVLVEEVGVEPGAELRRLHEAILRQDAELDLTVPDARWARRETVQRVGESAGIAAARRGELREEEGRLTEDLVDLQALREAAAAPPGDLRRLPGVLGEDAARPVCPFKGLASFDLADAGYFFGRERLVAEIVARLVGARLLGVVGPSGSGKSSTVRAGLLPALEDGVLPGSERWRTVVIRPGEHPRTALRDALDAAEHPDPVSAAVASLDRLARLVVVVDQFEETFTACRDASERDAFVGALEEAAARDDGRVLVVLALRADFYGACAQYPRLARLLGASHVLVGPMEREELARAIEGPAAKAGLLLEPGLVERLVDDVAGQAGGLPLLSSALLELWQQRDGRRLQLAAYERVGGVRGAVARLAENAYASLGEEEQQASRRILMRLAGSGEGESVVRRRVPLSELELGDDEPASRVLEVLAGSRLVTVGDEAVEVAHEALLREWPRLRDWIEQDVEGRRLHRHITLAARDWDAGGRDPGELYRGARLASALDWASERGDDLNRLEREFLEAARRQSEEQARRARAANRRLRASLIASVTALAVAIVAGLAAIDQRGDARQAALVADAQRVGAEALTEDGMDRALLLARAGVELDESAVTRGHLFSALLRSPPAALGIVHPAVGDPEVYAAGISPDGRRFAMGDGAGNVTLFETSSRRRLGVYSMGERGPGSGLVQSVTFSPDGSTLAVTGADRSEPGELVDLVDVRTLDRRRRIALPPFPDPADFSIVTLAWLAGGRDFVVAQAPGAITDGPPSVLHRVNGRTGKIEEGPLRLGRHGSLDVVSTSDGRRLFVTSERDDETYEIDPDALRVMRTHPHGGFAGAVSADGRSFALGSSTGDLRILDLVRGRLEQLPRNHAAGIFNVGFTPDGRTLISTDGDGEVIVWDIATGTVRERLSAHRGQVWDIATSPDGRTLYTAGDDARTILWDLSESRRMVRYFALGRAFRALQTPRGIASSPDGRTLAYSHSDGSVDLVDTRTLKLRGTVAGIPGFAAAVEFSPDGRLLAVTGEGGRLTLWSPRTLEPMGRLDGLAADSQALAFSPDGRQLVAAEVDTPEPRLLAWDVRRLGPFRVLRRTHAHSLAFSPDGKLIAAAATENGTEILDSTSGDIVERLPTEGLARSVAFSRDGALLAVGQWDGDAQLYSTESWQRVGPLLEGHTQRVTFIEFSPDGRTLATASADGTAALWDVATQKPVGSPITVAADTFTSLAFRPDGAGIFALSTKRRGLFVDTRPSAWKRHACLVAGRDLTRREWEDVLPSVPYRTVCGPN